MHTGISETSPLQQLALEARQELYDILHWWASKMPDHEHGGFYGRIDGTGLLHGQSDKSVILNTRILWTFSAAALQTGKTAYREVADRAYHYILDYFWDAQYGGVYWMLDYKGHPSQDKKQVYAQAFAMYAFSEYYRLTQDETALQKARTLFDLMERHSLDKMRGGYFEAFSRDWQLIIDLLNSATVAAFDPTLRAKLAESGIEVATSTPEELQQLIAHDIKLHAELVKAAGLVPQ